MADRIGQQLGNYRLVALLGQGSYAEVYLGQHVRLTLQVAIKVLHTHLTGQEAEHFQQEAETIARLMHPSIVRILDYDVQAGVPFLVMDYAPNGSLRRRYPKGTVVPLPHIVSWVKQIAAALQFAHEQKFIHRDVKPENMLLGRQQEVLLSDFGLAALAHSSASLSIQEAMGTLPYMAPEQIEGHPRAASDQYAMGVVVYEWLCGSRPFEGSLSEVMVQHLSLPPPPLRERVPTVQGEVEQVVLKALAKDPKQRFVRVQDFALALEVASTVASTGSTQLMLASGYTAEAQHTTKHNLPAHLTPLLGREQEVMAACAFLQRPDVRLVTLTGAGGVGKTRLALQVATEVLDDFTDGVSFISLAPISDPDLVASTIAQVCGVKESGARPLLDLLKAYLRDKHLLLVLDNFEQILPAAPHLTNLLTSCPHLTILVTSRATLHVQGEYNYPVPPLALPDLTQLPEPEVLSHYHAVALFLQCAQATKPTFQITTANARTIAEICIRLDGLPLAIELAAARIKLLSPQALLARLEHRLQVLTSGTQDAPTRQQTLRNTIAWSYDLLSAQEQRLFRRLSVFVGGCTLEAVEALCTALDERTERVLDGVASLLDKNLLQQAEQEGEEPRLMMLETIREYGLEALRASGEMEATQQAHIQYYLQLAEEVAPNLFGAEQQRWSASLEQEHANLRTALQWSFERQEAELTLRLSEALWWFWLIQSHLSEGRHWLELALSAREGDVTSIRADVLNGLGLLLLNLGDYEQTAKRCEESVALYRELGDTVGMAWPLHHLALAKLDQGECTSARAVLEECLAHFSKGGDKEGRAYVLCHLALIDSEQGKYDEARSHAEESLTLFRELEDNIGISEALTSLARVLFLSQGSKSAVHALLEEYLALSKGGSVQYPSAQALLAEFTLSQGDIATARSLVEKCLAFSRTEGFRANIAETLIMCGRVTAAQGDYAAAQTFYEESLALAKELGCKRVLPAGLEGVAAVVAAQGEPAWAARLWGAAEALREAMDTLIPPVYRATYERSVAAARIQLGEQTFATAWVEGRAMSPEQALAAREPETTSTPVPARQPSPLPVMARATYPDGLTAREVEVLRLVAQGLTDAQVAEQLVISPRTVHAHLSSIYSKLGMASRNTATRYAIEHKLT
jgi:predicted ATPase/DNA-binding CsgD family transcriptional regulator